MNVFLGSVISVSARISTSRTSPFRASSFAAQAEELIKKEMAKGDKKIEDYLSELPPVPESRLKDHPVLQNELARVAKGEPMAPLDVSRYRWGPCGPRAPCNTLGQPALHRAAAG